MIIDPDLFESQTSTYAERLYKDEIVGVTETSKLTLVDIHNAQDDWPQIENPVTLPFNHK